MDEPNENESGQLDYLDTMDDFYRRIIADMENKEERFPNLLSVWKAHIVNRRNKFIAELRRCKLLLDSMENGTANDLSLSQITRLVCLMHIINTGNST